MKVLFVLGRIPENSDTSGLDRWFFNSLKAMRPLVERIDVVGQSNGTIENFSKIDKNCDQIFIVAPINHAKYRYKWLAGWDYSKIFSYNPFFIRLLQDLCSENLYDLILLVGHGTHVNLPHLKARHIMAVPLDAPSGVMVSPASNDLVTFFKATFNKIVIRKSEQAYNDADSVLVVSEKDKDLLIKAGVTTKIIINPLSVDIKKFSPRRSQGQSKALLFTGILDFQPNYDAVIHLINDIYIPGDFYSKGIVCRIAGRRAPQIVKDLCKVKGVEIIENLPNLRPLIDDSFIYIAPMRVGLGMKTKILEAMAMGKPIVGYPLTFNGIKNPERFALVCHSPREIIEAINNLNQDINLRNDLGKMARKFAEEYYSLEQNISTIFDQVEFKNY